MNRTLLIIFAFSWPVIADTADYLTGFKVPVQQTFCMSRSLNGDMDTYKRCMLTVEKESYKCDKGTKPAYERAMAKYSNYDKDVAEYMNDIKPITKIHFDCLCSLY